MKTFKVQNEGINTLLYFIIPYYILLHLLFFNIPYYILLHSIILYYIYHILL